MGSTPCPLEDWTVHMKVIFMGISKLNILFCPGHFSCQGFSLPVPSFSHMPQRAHVGVRKNFPHPSLAQLKESAIRGTRSVVSNCKHPTR